MEIRGNLSRTKPNVVIFTDALSVLNKLQNLRQEDLNKMETALIYLPAQTNLTLHRFQHTAGSKEMNKQTGLLGKGASWTKRTDIPLTQRDRRIYVGSCSCVCVCDVILGVYMCVCVCV